MIKKILIISILLLPSLFTEVYAGCTISSGPSPELAKYIRYIDTEIARVKTSAKWSCAPGVVGSADRTIDILDKAKIQIPMSSNILQDFQYNVILALRGEIRSEVTRDGLIFAQIEKKLLSTLDILGNKCALDGEAESTIARLIRQNVYFENYYKWVALEQVSMGESDLEIDIWQNYTPSATSSCQGSTDPFGDIGKKLAAIQKNGLFTQDSTKEWKEAIALLRWDGVGKKWYNDIQKNLLMQELQRQWLTKNMQDSIMKNFSCMSSASTEKSSRDSGGSEVADTMLAQSRCFQNPILGYEWLWTKLTDWQRTSPTTTDYIVRGHATEALKSDVTGVEVVYATLSAAFSKDDPIIDASMDNLLNMHGRLLSLNATLEKRIPEMQKNCMKANPSVIGGCRKQ
jgi:hypothetical protein